VGAREGILKFGFTSGQASDMAAFVADISAFVHDFRVSSRDPGRMSQATIVVGDTKTRELISTQRAPRAIRSPTVSRGSLYKSQTPGNWNKPWLMPSLRV
jgi:hypothetical protein